jgi:tRNA nucleotidyltransferase (CCA-adding enzyme)
VLCHLTADFDALGAAVGVARLNPGTRIVLCGGSHPTVTNFLALYRDEFPFIERRSVNPKAIRRITVVDAQKKSQLGLAADWLEQPQVEIEIWDHHLSQETDIKAAHRHVEAVGATTTLMVERCQQEQPRLSIADLTVMALGIHVDTGSLTYEGATPRDALALAWLMANGANQRAIADYIEPGFSPELQDILKDVLDQLETSTIQGSRLAWVLIQTPEYVPGLSSLASQLLALSESDVCLLGHIYHSNPGSPQRLSVIARSRIEGLDLSLLLGEWGGGGHGAAAALTVKTEAPEALMHQIVAKLKDSLPTPPSARDVMSSPVRTIRPDSTINQARRILLRYGHSGLSVVDERDRLVGVISRRDLDIALHHGFGHAPVKGYMTRPVQTITPETLLPDIESLMVRYDIGRLPVIQDGMLLGMVTRTDILRQLHQLKQPQGDRPQDAISTSIQTRLEKAVPPHLYQLLTDAAQEAEKNQWQLYLVGGAVRDLLMTPVGESVSFKEFDLVVDGVLNTKIASVGGALAMGLQQRYPDAQLQVYGQFQTATLIWHSETDLGPFSMDIATARSEFYPYPAANPEVSISSVRQDLYRRDFTINALAIRLTSRPQMIHSGGSF